MLLVFVLQLALSPPWCVCISAGQRPVRHADCFRFLYNMMLHQPHDCTHACFLHLGRELQANHKIVGWGSQLPAAAPAPVAPVATAAPVMLQSVATAPQAILPSVATAPLSAAGPSAQQALQPSQQLHADAGPGPSRSAPAGTAACGREAGMSKGRKEGQDAGKDAAARQQLVDLLDEDVVMMLEHEGVDLQVCSHRASTFRHACRCCKGECVAAAMAAEVACIVWSMPWMTCCTGPCRHGLHNMC